jgi:endonuclease YncB( thermonuclease family)
MTVKNTEILQSNYKAILSEIQKLIFQTESNIVRNVMRQKVEMAWKIGKEINKHLSENDKDESGRKLIERLEKDVGISKTVLYKMRNFYKTYPKIPKDDERLNWSHYRILSGIKKSDERKYLENLVKQNGWDDADLQEEMNKIKSQLVVKNKVSNLEEKKNLVVQKENVVQKITPTRGKLFSYQIVKIEGVADFFFDCGFGVFKKVDVKLPREVKKADQIVAVEKKSSDYLVKKDAIHPRKLYAYKAYLERVVDGDTIRVNLDLGFGIFHHEILRLAKINAPEIDSEAGKNGKKVLSKILQDVPFLVVKTIKTDIYGRYVADVFLAEKVDLDAQEVANSGVYLNKILLDEGVVEVF